MPSPADDIRFLRLSEVPPEAILAHMRHPRLADHMPLLTFEWTPERVAEFVAAKEACWQSDGLGHWAFTAGGEYVGWGGFQKEGEEWDFGLVLRPDRFGLGRAIASKALAIARADPRIPFVTFLLPPSRRHLGALQRLGARELGHADYAGHSFRKFRLDTV
jgi:hypothetical protein